MRDHFWDDVSLFLMIIVIGWFLLALAIPSRGEPALPQGLTCGDIRRIVQTLSPEELAYYAKQLTPQQLKAVKQCLT